MNPPLRLQIITMVLCRCSELISPLTLRPSCSTSQTCVYAHIGSLTDNIFKVLVKTFS